MNHHAGPTLPPLPAVRYVFVKPKGWKLVKACAHELGMFLLTGAEGIFLYCFIPFVILMVIRGLVSGKWF